MADYSRQVNTERTFTDQSSENPTSFEWDFGDGTPKVTTAQRTVTHTYTKTGTFTVTHKATNACGVKTCTKTIEITTAAPEKEAIGAPPSSAGLILGAGVVIALLVAAAMLKGRKR